jgi:hypothetical protein
LLGSFGSLPSGGSLREAKVRNLEIGPLHNLLAKRWSEPKAVRKVGNDNERKSSPSQGDSSRVLKGLAV